MAEMGYPGAYQYTEEGQSPAGEGVVVGPCDEKTTGDIRGGFFYTVSHKIRRYPDARWIYVYRRSINTCTDYKYG